MGQSSRTSSAYYQSVRRWPPVVFVLLWSTGFIVARFGTRDAGPLTFLMIRTAIAAIVLALVARAMGERRLTKQEIAHQSWVGLGMHALYLGGVFVAIDRGLPSGVSALIAALHPVLTTVVARWVLNEELTMRRGLGVVLGTGGVIAVVVERGGAGDSVPAFALLAMAVAVMGMAGGTIMQRRGASGVPLVAGTAWQYITTTGVLAVGVITWEGWDFTVTAQSLFSIAWAVGVLSVAAVLIMLWLLKHHAASQVSSLFFLTPALSTLEAAILFGERLGTLSIFGLVIAMVGVYLATSR